VVAQAQLNAKKKAALAAPLIAAANINYIE